MRCFNCGESLSLAKFLQGTDGLLYKEYCLENFKEGIWESSDKVPEVQIPIPQKTSPSPVKINYLESLIPYKSLLSNHPAMLYVKSRGIPENRYLEFFISPKFYAWASKIDPIFLKFKTDVPRLVIPYYGLNNDLLGFSCRAFGKEIPKYIHLRVNREKEFIYGLNHINTEKPILVVEGQIDSMFLDNCLAIGRASYKSVFLETHKDKIIIIPDNDFRRNPNVCSQLKKAIEEGYNVCILPEYWKKDINEIIKSGISSLEIEKYVLSNKKNGASALLELALERKCNG